MASAMTTGRPSNRAFRVKVSTISARLGAWAATIYQPDPGSVSLPH